MLQVALPVEDGRGFSNHAWADAASPVADSADITHWLAGLEDAVMPEPSVLWRGSGGVATDTEEALAGPSWSHSHPHTNRCVVSLCWTHSPRQWQLHTSLVFKMNHLVHSL